MPRLSGRRFRQRGAAIARNFAAAMSRSARAAHLLSLAQEDAERQRVGPRPDQLRLVQARYLVRRVGAARSA
jgi:hypothetical protein